MSEKCDIIEENLRDHLERYADNNKELQRLGDIIERQEEINKEQQRKIDEMYMVFISSGWTIRTMVKILAGLGVSAGGIIGVVKLYHLFFK